MQGGKIIRVKYGYNPNSSSIGSELGPLEDIIKKSTQASTHSFSADIRYWIGIFIAQVIIFFTIRYFYLLIKLKRIKSRKK